MWRLFFPLRYFALQNAEKGRLDVVPTAILVALIAGPYLLIPEANFYASGGFLDKLLVLTSALTAFYVAALVAVATMSNPGLDETMKAGAVYVRQKEEDGSITKRALSRRQFALTIFGYLAFAAMCLSVSAAVTIPINDVNYQAHPAPAWMHFLFVGWLHDSLRIIGIIVLAAMAAHIVVVTALGLYYLIDRLHVRRPEVVTPRQRDAA